MRYGQMQVVPAAAYDDEPQRAVMWARIEKNLARIAGHTGRVARNTEPLWLLPWGELGEELLPRHLAELAVPRGQDLGPPNAYMLRAETDTLEAPVEIVSPTGISSPHEADPSTALTPSGSTVFVCRSCGHTVWRDDAGAWEHVEAGR